MVQDKQRKERAVTKRYCDYEEYEESLRSRNSESDSNSRSRTLPFYDFVQKNIKSFDVGGLREKAKLLRAIGFESWQGVMNGCVAAFRSKFDLGGQHKNGGKNVSETSDHNKINNRGVMNEKQRRFKDCGNRGCVRNGMNKSRKLYSYNDQVESSLNSCGSQTSSILKDAALVIKDSNVDVKDSTVTCDPQSDEENFKSTCHAVFTVAPKAVSSSLSKGLICASQGIQNDTDSSGPVRGGDDEDNKNCLSVACSKTSEQGHFHGVIYNAERAELLPSGKVAVGLGVVLLPPWPIRTQSQIVRWYVCLVTQRPICKFRL